MQVSTVMCTARADGEPVVYQFQFGSFPSGNWQNILIFKILFWCFCGSNVVKLHLKDEGWQLYHGYRGGAASIGEEGSGERLV